MPIELIIVYIAIFIPTFAVAFWLQKGENQRIKNLK
jgi:hypothetical protein